MLEELEIRNFALIEHLKVSFTEGLNVLTGETGAGKSIIMDAVNAVLAGKSGAAALKAGSDKAVIEATFRQSPETAAWLKQQELQNEDGDRLTIAREITKSGSRLRVNGTLVNAAAVAELRQKLVSIHAQHDARTLLASPAQLELLDGLGDRSHKKLKEQVQTFYEAKRQLASQLKEMQMAEDERLRLLDFTCFQLKELEEADLTDAGEDERIAQECRVLEHAVDLENAAAAAQQHLSGSEMTESQSASDLLQEVVLQVERAATMDPQLLDLHNTLANCLEAVEQSARYLRRYRDGLDTDPDRLASLQARLAVLAGIKRKYGPSLAQAIDKGKELKEKVEQLNNAQAAITKIESELAEIEQKLNTAAGELSSARQKMGKLLGKQIQSTLCELGMERCRFEIAFEKCEVGPAGGDRVEFLISANPGQPMLPLAKIASGGELSRVMLAVKSIFAGADSVATVVFDEIDTGLSGRILQTMRDKLAQLSLSHQILCITHQPIIAAAAKNHILVSKTQTAESTTIYVSVLNESERIKSLAEMAGGQSNQEEALSFAASLLSDSTFRH